MDRNCRIGGIALAEIQLENGGSPDRTIDSILQDESCPMCQRLLDQVKDLPRQQQKQALEEYNGLKELMLEDPEEYEVADFVDDTEILVELL